VTAALALLAGLAVAAERPEHPTAALVGGGSAPGHWDAGASVGYPWQTTRLQVGLSGGWTPMVEVESALFTRNRPAVGVGLRWIDRSWRVTGEALAGWLLQSGTLARRGPSGELRVRASRAKGGVLPYLHLGSQHALLVDRTIVDTARGDEVTHALDHEWTLTGGLGCGFAIGRRWGLDLGLDLPWVDVPTVSIPGLHLGVQFGGGR
jgi:hypothetical protein